MSTLAEETEEAGEHAAAWSYEDDWTRETLRLVRDLRTPHRRKKAGQIGYTVYCVALLLAVWGGLPSLGLFLEKSMGADYSGHGPAILAALPAGSCALGLGWLLVAAWDAQWRGPVVPPRETVDWLLAQPVDAGRVLRPWFWGAAAISGGAGLLVSAIGTIALGLTVGVGLPAAFGWCLLGGVGLPLLATALATAVEGNERVARWARLATPYVGMAVLALAAQTVMAVNGHRLPGLERVELWSGPWGWAGLAALAPTPAALPGGQVAGVLLAVVVAGALIAAHRYAGSLALSAVRRRSRTATGVMAALRTVEFRTARQVVAGVTGGSRSARWRLPAPRWAQLAVPWRDMLALLRAPGRLGRALVLGTLAVLGAVLAASAHGGTGVTAALAALVFGYWSLTQLMEPARLETDDTRRASWAPYPYRDLMLRHTAVPVALGLVGTLVAAGVLAAEGAGARALLAPALVPALVGASLVNACRGATKHHLLMSSAQSPAGSLGPVLFLGWYGSGMLAAVALLVVPLLTALHSGSAESIVTAVAASGFVTVIMVRWAVTRIGNLTAPLTD
ncbi:hypothetical protein ABZ883_00460 [Streptomyces sp. NPDC046977]|uniref:hypothetical protein n=1 Tax=Streptomyces sp. NPDC046977 TaxID=3154703 RepID=UPI0033C4035E